MKACEECGAVAHGNLFCNTCRSEINKWLDPENRLPPWPYPAEKPCGAEEVRAFKRKLNKINGEDT